MAALPKRPGREETRRRILAAAIEVFADKGFGLTRVAEIAAAAGVAEGTIYLYFKSKDDVLVALFRERMAEIRQRFAALLAEITDPEQKLRRYVAEHLALAAEQPKLMRVLTVELRQSASFIAPHVAQPFGRYLALLTGIIEDGQAKGRFRSDVSPALLGRALFGACDEIALAWSVGGRPGAPGPDHAAAARQLAELVLRGLRPDVPPG